MRFLEKSERLRQAIRRWEQIVDNNLTIVAVSRIFWLARVGLLLAVLSQTQRFGPG